MNSEDEFYEDDDYDHHCSDDNAAGDDAADAGEQKSYVVLKEDEIRARQEDDITKISSLLFVSRAAACILLSRHRWSAAKVEEAWFTDEDGVRKAVGLFEKPLVIASCVATCGICFEDYPPDALRAAACGHPFCVSCWAAYISTAINDGPGCLNLRCPAVPKCSAAIGGDMIDALASDRDKEKYRFYLLRSYIEDGEATKWCPAPGCDCAVEFETGDGGNYDVFCHCSNSFCWNCTEEAHSPVDCDTVSKWILKNTSEAENTTWIIANSKPCPKCRRPIEKNMGCMHMTCTAPCYFEFCWICLGSWRNHKNCNSYKSDSQYKNEEQQRELAKKALERYTHYYERWAANHSSRQKALSDLHEVRTTRVKRLSETRDLPETWLEFITEAWLQIAECRRVLKWSYAYGYYCIPEEEKGKKVFFEYLQGEAEAGLERLHHCAENELQKHLDKYRGDFIDFRTKLTGLTKVTGTYFANLVRALENGLVDVNPQETSKGGVFVDEGIWTNNGDFVDEGVWSCDVCHFENALSERVCQRCRMLDSDGEDF